MRRRYYGGYSTPTNIAPGTDRNIDVYDDAKRSLAKLMARENITVQFLDGVPTATFDTVGRVLTLPNWPNITVDQLDLLIGHEVSHALNTDHTFIERLAQRKKNRQRVMSYFNVVEDARIEKKIRESYPGMNSVFYNGYRDFTTGGPIFQRINDDTVLVEGEKHSVRAMSLIDRINLHYKVGAFFNIPFRAQEQKFLQLIDNCYSTENAFDIAEMLFDYAKDTEPNLPPMPATGAQSKSKQGGLADEADDNDGKSKSKGKDSKGKGKSDKGDKGDKDEQGKGKDGDDEADGDDSADAEGNDSGDSGDGDTGTDEGKDGDGADADGEGTEADGDGDETEADGEDTGKRSSQNASNKRNKGNANVSPEEPEGSLTDDALSKALQKLVEDGKQNPAAEIKHLLLKPLPADEVRKRTVTAMDWTERAESALSRLHKADELKANVDAIEAQWNAKYMPTVRHMVSEWQRKKQAKRMQKARTARTGRLDVNRLHSYKFADDLFKRSMVVPDGQSHGIVAMIDGSSSMTSVFGNVLDQLLLFAHFAFTCNVPFEAYMFSDSTIRPDVALDVPALGPQTITPPANGRLVGLINTVTDRAAFRRQVRMVLAVRAAYDGANDYDYGINRNAKVRGREIPYMSLGGTPLYAGMMVMERHVERMKRINKLDRMMAIVMSDGGDTNGLHYQTHDVAYDGRIYEKYATVGETAFVVRDSVTKRNHAFIQKQDGNYVAMQNAVLTLLFDVMKERHDCRTTMMFLTSGYGAPNVEPIMRRAGVLEPGTDANTMNEKFTANGMFMMPEGSGAADCCIIMENATLKLKEDEFAQQNVKGANIADAFIKAQKEAQKSRVFVNTIVPYLA